MAVNGPSGHHDNRVYVGYESVVTLVSMTTPYIVGEGRSQWSLWSLMTIHYNDCLCLVRVIMSILVSIPYPAKLSLKVH